MESRVPPVIGKTIGQCTVESGVPPVIGRTIGQCTVIHFNLGTP